MPHLPAPTVDDAAAWVGEHLGDLVAADDPLTLRPARRGGQTAADAALAALDVTGYARRRSQVHPHTDRCASVISPYVRHGLLTLADVVEHVERGDAPAQDRRRFVDELWWQEYARHLYARAGAAGRSPRRRDPAAATPAWPDPLPDEMECMREVRAELATTGFLVNQTRMWLASQWTVRAGHDWETGEDWMFRHLLDGSRAANRYGWLWSVGAMTSKPYGFSRWQVERRAPAWCARCPVRDRCPIEQWPTATSGEALEHDHLRRGPDLAGPREPEVSAAPDVVWLTAESLGSHDPALVAWPDLPAAFVLDEPLLRRLRLSAKRLVFVAETLAELATTRPLTIVRGDPVAELSGRALAVTYAPVPGFVTRSRRLHVAALHPYPWLARPDGGDVRSHSAWIRRARRSASGQLS
jgi:deoxyribodipyrimidine photo-lyase